MIDLGLAGKDLKNPLVAWEYVYGCWKRKEPLPDWVMDYLGPAAEKMITMKPATGKHAMEIKNALGFKDCRVFEAYHNPPPENDYNGLLPKIYEAVEKEMKQRKHGEKGTIFYDVGRRFFGKVGKPGEKTRKLYYHYKSALEAYAECQRETIEADHRESQEEQNGVE